MALSIGDATQAAKAFQQMAASANNDGDVEKAVSSFTKQIHDATSGEPLTGSDIQALESGFESLGLNQSDFEQNVSLARAFQTLGQVPTFSALELWHLSGMFYLGLHSIYMGRVLLKLHHRRPHPMTWLLLWTWFRAAWTQAGLWGLMNYKS